MFDFCKWDPQVGDVSSLCEFPLILATEVWQQIAQVAEKLGAETLAAEAELAAAPRLHRALGLPRSLRLSLKQNSHSVSDRTEPRVMRFDFHYTRDGWRISEVNSDVPGGFIEASAFTQLVAEHYPGTQPAGDPAQAYVNAIQRCVANHDLGVAFVHATSYVDDRQVMIYLARLLAQRGIPGYLASPADLQWRDGQASVAHSSGMLPVAALVRFFPAEWLPNLDRRTGWNHFFGGSRTPLSNPGRAILTQSKRFPLVWDQLKTSLPTWRTTLPQTCDPRHVHWQQDDQWVLKPALGRIGEAIGLRGVTDTKEWRAISRSARWWPRDWIAQQRFEAVPLMRGDRRYYPVVGVYVIDGKACGIYGRLARRPLINYEAQDIAILIDTEPRANTHE